MKEDYVNRALRAAAAAYDSGYMFDGEEIQVTIDHGHGCAALSSTNIACTCNPAIQLAATGVSFKVDLAGDPHIVESQPEVVH